MESPSSRTTVRSLSYTPGALSPGLSNSILDIPGLAVGQTTRPTTSSLPSDSTAAKGVTVIFPRGTGPSALTPCLAGVHVFNGNGCLTGTQQIADWGFTNTPLAFTNSLSLGTVFDGAWDWILDWQDRGGINGRERSRMYGTPVVGETADWLINEDVRQSRVDRADIATAFNGAKTLEQGGIVEEGQRGGGAGMTCHQVAGGTGTASRLVKGDHASGPEGSEKEFVLGVLVQTNYGGLGELRIGGVPIGPLLMEDQAKPAAAAVSAAAELKTAGRAEDGSILILIATNAPLSTVQLQRLARHATAGLASVGGNGIGRNFSGDIFLAISTADHPGEKLIGPSGGTDDAIMGGIKPTQTYQVETVKNECIDTYFGAAAEAVEEAILNSIVAGSEGVVTMNGKTKIAGLPLEKVKGLLEKYLVKV